MNELARTEYLYELWDANWDDGPLGNWQVLRHEITKKTLKRIHFTCSNGRTGTVDRQQIEAAGQVFYRPRARTLYLTPPEIPHQPKRATLAELKQAMADAHPDRGGSHEAFIAARRRYETAKARQDGAPSTRPRCPVCGADLSTYHADELVYRTGDQRPHCSGECVVTAHRAEAPQHQAQP